MVVQQSRMEVGHAITIGRCYQRVDQVRLAIDTYNDTSEHELPRSKNNNNNNNNNIKNNIINSRKPCRQCSRILSGKYSSFSSSTSSRRSRKQQSARQPCCLYKQMENEERRSDAALELAHAYKGLLKELDTLEDEDGIGADDDLLSCLRQTNDQLFNINETIVQSQQRSQKKKISPPSANQELSLDGLEEFLGTLMVEAEEKEAEEEKGRLKEGSKYKLIMPVLTRIGRMISQHPKQQFESYHEHLSKLEAAIRVGERNVNIVEDPECQNSDSESSESSQNLEPKSPISSRSPTPESSGSSEDLCQKSLRSSQNPDDVSWTFSQNLDEDTRATSECTSELLEHFPDEESTVADSIYEDSVAVESIAEDSLVGNSVIADSLVEDSLAINAFIADVEDVDTMSTLSQSLPSLELTSDEDDNEDVINHE